VDESGNALLCDFGRIQYGNTEVLQAGRVHFIAPELWLGQDPRRTTEASDTYSLAMMIYALGTQQRPFSEYHNDIAVMNATLSGTRPEQPESLGGLSPHETAGLWKIMSHMWKQDPLRRPSMHLVKACFNMLFDTSNTP
jgi:serine/threonine protein kinase